MSDAEFLAEMWTRAVNCGVYCFLQGDEIVRLRALAGEPPFDYKMEGDFEYQPTRSGGYRKTWVGWMYHCSPSALREIALLGMQREGRVHSMKVAAVLEAAL